jgi:hypothetical protein
VAQATRAVAKHRGKLDPDGCLVRFASQPAERENGRGQSLQERRWRALLQNIDATILRRFDFVLDSGRLMGVWCDSLRNQQSEKTGAVRVCRKEGGVHCCKILTQLFCDGLILSLTPAG